MPNRRNHHQKHRPTDRTEDVLASVDIGSNSFHLAIAHVRDGKLKKIAAMSEKVQLALGLDKHGRLDPAIQDKGLACLTRFAGQLREIPTDRLRVVATNTLRQAVNANEFISRANTILPCPIEIISGREEARLIYLAVAHAIPSANRRLVIDIGGGSTEFIVGQHFTATLTQSAQVGCVSFSRRFFDDGVIDDMRFRRTIDTTKKELAPIVAVARKERWDEVIGTSGTIKAVFGVLAAQSLLDDGKYITLAGVQALQAELVKAGHCKSITIAGVKERRKALLPAGVAILLAIFDVFGIDRISYNDNALKEGVMYDMIERITHKDIRDDSVWQLLDGFAIDKNHAKRVQKTATQLLSATADSLRLNNDDANRLRWAAWLHEIGLSIGHSAYHRHSAYIVQHAEMAGFSQAEQSLLSTIIANHRRHLKTPRTTSKNALSQNTLYLILLLRLAVIANIGRCDDAGTLGLEIISKHHWQANTTQVSDLVRVQLQDEVAWFSRLNIHLELV